MVELRSNGLVITDTEKNGIFVGGNDHPMDPNSPSILTSNRTSKWDVFFKQRRFRDGLATVHNPNHQSLQKKDDNHAVLASVPMAKFGRTWTYRQKGRNMRVRETRRDDPARFSART